MKKIYYLMAAGAVALSACTSTELVDEQIAHTNAIGFENVVTNQTRATATQINNEVFKNFWVYGYYTKSTGGAATPVFNNIQVTRAGTAWQYDTKRYWIPGVVYNFYALSCAGVPFAPAFGMSSMDTNASNQQDRALVIRDYVCNNNHQHDLLFARYENYTSETDSTKVNKPVSFNFQHILSKLNFTFKSNFPEGYNIQISEIRLDWIYDKATFNDDNTNGWSLLQKSEIGYIDVDMTNNMLSSNVDQSSSDIFVIPYNYKNTKEELAHISFMLDIYSGTEHVYTHKVYAQWSPMWVMGNYYKYTITVEGGNTGLGEIEFDASIQNENGEWGQGEVTPIVVVG